MEKYGEISPSLSNKLSDDSSYIMMEQSFQIAITSKTLQINRCECVIMSKGIVTCLQELWVVPQLQ